MSSVLLQELSGGVLTLTLNRPDKRNALNTELVAALSEALHMAESDPDVRVVLVKGAGKDFSAGADLAELERTLDQGRDAHLDNANRLGALFLALRRHPVPVIAAVQGRALAGGCGLATACDLVFASEAAQFGYPEVNLGFVPAMVMAILRRKVGEAAAFDLAVMGERIPATRAYELGLVARLLPEEGFDASTQELAAALAAKPAEAIRMTKRLLYDQDGRTFAEGVAMGAEVNARARSTEGFKAGVRAFLAKQSR
ncbi:MAG: enoyl-CoA hydratase/isomerase family protein [Gemmatimonadota bacterium]